MKNTILSLALVLSTVVSANPAMQVAPELIVRDTLEGTVDCSYCTDMLDFCFKVSSDIIVQVRSREVDHDVERSYSRPGGLQADLP